jgi:carbonic anhydrase/acetyltransferase-like protein (isoleucine patch superfamily)
VINIAVLNEQMTIGNLEPTIHPDACIARTALVSGDVTIGGGTVVLDGAVIVAESAPVRIGEECVIMEHAVVRGGGSHPAVIGSHVLIGPHTHITGAVVGDDSLIATHASVFNGAELGAGTLVAVGAIVHVMTRLHEGGRVPMLNIAVGDPAEIFTPDRAEEAHKRIEAVGFTKAVFDHDTAGMPFRDTMARMCHVYSRALRANTRSVTARAGDGNRE